MPQNLIQIIVKIWVKIGTKTHELYLHTIGNLTLTAYNTELSNDDFDTKRKTLNESHLELNKYFTNIPKMDKKRN